MDVVAVMNGRLIDRQVLRLGSVQLVVAFWRSLLLLLFAWICNLSLGFLLLDVFWNLLTRSYTALCFYRQPGYCRMKLSVLGLLTYFLHLGGVLLLIS